MSAGSIAIAVMLGIGIAICYLSSLGVTLVKRDLDRLHFLSPTTALAVPAVGIAVVIHESAISLAGAKVLIITVVLWLSGPVVNHALARAERMRAVGRRQPREEREVQRS